MRIQSNSHFTSTKLQIDTTVFSSIEAWVAFAMEGEVYDVMVRETNVMTEKEQGEDVVER